MDLDMKKGLKTTGFIRSSELGVRLCVLFSPVTEVMLQRWEGRVLQPNESALTIRDLEGTVYVTHTHRGTQVFKDLLCELDRGPGRQAGTAAVMCWKPVQL